MMSSSRQQSFSGAFVPPYRTEADSTSGPLSSSTPVLLICVSGPFSRPEPPMPATQVAAPQTVVGCAELPLLNLQLQGPQLPSSVMHTWHAAAGGTVQGLSSPHGWVQSLLAPAATASSAGTSSQNVWTQPGVTHAVSSPGAMQLSFSHGPPTQNGEMRLQLMAGAPPQGVMHEQSSQGPSAHSGWMQPPTMHVATGHLAMHLQSLYKRPWLQDGCMSQSMMQAAPAQGAMRGQSSQQPPVQSGWMQRPIAQAATGQCAMRRALSQEGPASQGAWMQAAMMQGMPMHRLATPVQMPFTEAHIGQEAASYLPATSWHGQEKGAGVQKGSWGARPISSLSDAADTDAWEARNWQAQRPTAWVHAMQRWQPQHDLPSEATPPGGSA